MKYTIFIILGLLLLSCSAKKNEKNKIAFLSEESEKVVLENLSNDETNIVNDFLDFELASERYKNKINNEIIVIEDAGNGIENLLAYEYAYRDFHSYGNKGTAEDNERLGWILDSLQIKELKNKYSDKKEYHWKSSDIKNFKLSIMKDDTLRNYLKKDRFLELSEKLVLFIKKPLMIDKENAFISIYSREGFVGHNIDNYTALMKKTNGKWKIGASFWDGSIE